LSLARPLKRLSIYSVLDGIIHPKALMKKVKELGMTSIGVTDHGNLHGLIEFYKAAQEENVKLLCAVEAYITQDPDNSEEKTRDNNHLVLIAKNNDGLKELYKLISEANINNFYYKPRIFVDKLRHTKNLIALSACLGSPISHKLQWDKEKHTVQDVDNAGLETAKYLASCFPGNFYLELKDHRESWEQIKYNEYLLDLGKKLGLPFVITTDAHYLNNEDFSTHLFVMAHQF
jgi:DNA polymerase-3 subunit alpha